MDGLLDTWFGPAYGKREPEREKGMGESLTVHARYARPRPKVMVLDIKKTGRPCRAFRLDSLFSTAQPAKPRYIHIQSDSNQSTNQPTNLKVSTNDLSTADFTPSMQIALDLEKILARRGPA